MIPVKLNNAQHKMNNNKTLIIVYTNVKSGHYYALVYVTMVTALSPVKLFLDRRSIVYCVLIITVITLCNQ